VTQEPSSANSKLSPELKEEPELDYHPLLYLQVEIKDIDGDGWTLVMRLLDSSSQSSCVNKRLSQNVLTDLKSKSNPVTMIMADENRSASAITSSHFVTVHIAGNEELVALDSASLSHNLIFGA
jgi:hypothetical protein